MELDRRVFSLPKFRIGQKVYVFREGCVFSATIEDVYRADGKWMYDVDCSTYHEGLELSMEDTCMSDKIWEEPKAKISRRKMDELVKQFKEQEL